MRCREGKNETPEDKKETDNNSPGSWRLEVKFKFLEEWGFGSAPQLPAEACSTFPATGNQGQGSGQSSKHQALIAWHLPPPSYEMFNETTSCTGIYR